jgi:O-antigen/teichoic acid export membrane protein
VAWTTFGTLPALLTTALWCGLVLLGLLRVAGAGHGRGRSIEADVVRRVMRNSALPIISQLFIRMLDLAVAIALLRLLGPERNGAYAVAVVVWLYVKTVSDFGLSLLATRDIARDPTRAGMIIGVTTTLRWIVLALAAAPVLVYVAIGRDAGTLTGDSAIAIALLYASIVPSSFSEAINAALNGLERMDVAAWLNVGVALIRAPLAVTLGATSLGIVGVAGAALLGAACSAAVLAWAYRAQRAAPLSWHSTPGERWRYARESWPLLVNALLISLFFRVDIFIVQAERGDRALGIYDASYKLINLLTIVPSYATLAIFPLLARRADDIEALRHAQRVGSYALVTLAWLLVCGVSALAGVAIHVLAGRAYLPEAALLLRILIWFAPLSFLNGVAQYALVAAGRQRRIVPAFGLAVAFNLTANLLFVPRYGARAAAVTTVLTEVVILAALMTLTRGQPYAPLDRAALSKLWRPTVAGVCATALALVLRDTPVLAAPAGMALFALLALVTRVVGPEERALALRALPRRWVRRVA